jgi:hypothetical protein
MRAPKKKPFSNSRKHSKFKLTNWPSYNKYLRNRGRIDFMIAEDLSDHWYDHSTRRRCGRQKKYSDLAIVQCLQIRYLFGLRLRQTEGFINYLLETSGFKIRCPDYTTLSKRGSKLGLESLLRDNNQNSNKNPGKEFTHVSMDSTGIQTYTGNEWLENKHGKQYTRRTWKKLHILIEEDGMILANSTTEHTEDDRSQVSSLLTNVKTKEFLGDPGYDSEAVYQLVRSKGIKPTIRPPNRTIEIKAKSLKAERTERDEATAYQQEKGYQAWRIKNNYGRREKVENTFFRFKTNFGSQFLSRSDANMKNENTIKCQLLNKMFQIGKPISMRVA